MTRNEIIRRAVEALLDIFQASERKDVSPEPPSRPEPEPRQLRQSEQPGINMNDMLRSIPKPRPPRKPSWER